MNLQFPRTIIIVTENESLDTGDGQAVLPVLLSSHLQSIPVFGKMCVEIVYNQYLIPEHGVAEQTSTNDTSNKNKNKHIVLLTLSITNNTTTTTAVLVSVSVVRQNVYSSVTTTSASLSTFKFLVSPRNKYPVVPNVEYR